MILLKQISSMESIVLHSAALGVAKTNLIVENLTLVRVMRNTGFIMPISQNVDII